MPDAISRLNEALEGRYTVERELGEGGMATVYLAEDLKHQRKVALKVLKPELAAVIGGERFLAEIRTTANLQHPHILPLFDSDEADGFLYYVMPYIEGESLRERIDREHQLPVDEAVRIAEHIASALDYAHEQGVIHRDIKPGNVLVSRGEPVVSDFGIALAVSTAGGGRLTETGLSLGTPHYMSPEQATGDQTVGPSTDIYALGCVLYEMLVGEPPHTGKTAQAILAKIITGEPDPVTEQRKAVPPNVEAVIRKALEKLPADRFTAARDFARALGDEHFRHGPESQSSRDPRSPWLRHPASLATLGLAALLGILALPNAQDPIAESGGRELVTRVLIEPEEGAWNNATLSISPDGRFLTWLSDEEGGIRVRALDGLDYEIIPGTEDFRRDGRGGFVAMGADGETVAFTMDLGNDNVRLFTIPRGGGRPLMVADSVSIAPYPSPIAWGYGDWIYFHHRDEGVRRVDSGGLEEQILLAGDTAVWGYWVGVLLPLPGDNALVFARRETRGFPTRANTFVVEVADGSVRNIGEGLEPIELVPGSGTMFVWDEAGAIRLVRFDLDSRELGSRLIPFPGERPFALGREGSALEFGNTSASRLNLVTLAGRTTPLTNPPGGATQPGPASPDGERLLLGGRQGGGLRGGGGGGQGPTGNAGLWLYDLRDGSALKLTEDLHYPIGWSSDGRFAFASNRARDSIFRIRTDGSGSVDLRWAGRHSGAAVAGDGTLIVAAIAEDESRDLVVSSPTGEARSLGEPSVMNSSGPNGGVGVSPDATWVTYVRADFGSAYVWMRRVDGTGEPVRISVEPARSALWSTDGGTLYYHDCTPVCNLPIRARITDGIVTSRQVLPIPRIDAVLPGDSVFVSNALGNRGADVVLVRNWDVEFRAWLESVGGID